MSERGHPAPCPPSPTSPFPNCHAGMATAPLMIGFLLPSGGQLWARRGEMALALGCHRGAVVTHGDCDYLSVEPRQGQQVPAHTARLCVWPDRRQLERVCGLCLNAFPERVRCGHSQQRVEGLAQETAPPVRLGLGQPHGYPSLTLAAAGRWDRREGDTLRGWGRALRQPLQEPGGKAKSVLVRHTNTPNHVFSNSLHR